MGNCVDNEIGALVINAVCPFIMEVCAWVIIASGKELDEEREGDVDVHWVVFVVCVM